MAMLATLLSEWLGRREPEPAVVLPRLIAGERPPHLYAIGDVHGCLDALLAAEARVLADARDAPGEKWLVMLGDYVDRGPQSAEVLDHLIAPPPHGFKRICLRGNHDAAMLAALEEVEALDDWLGWGVEPTLASYGMSPSQIATVTGRGRASARWQLLKTFVPEEHIAFLRDLPVLLSVPGYLFVHAGLRPGLPPERQSDRDLLWIRDEFLLADHDFGAVVIHGHTPGAEPFLSARRVGIDTACFASGTLTAIRVRDDGVRVV